MTPFTSFIFANKFVRLLYLFLLLSLVSIDHVQAADDLFNQIQTLQNQAKIEITGLEKIQNGEKILTSGTLEQQVKQIFSSYNHIVSRNSKGKIKSIVIVNKKQPREDNRILVPTNRRDKHYTVSVSLSGDGRNWQTLEMVIDTGADLVVLPESMIAQLGLADSHFNRAQMQTANGLTDAKIGKLSEVKIAGETLENVEVAFIADRLLGENRLLGMSVLERYQVNIDDKTQLITLIRK